MPHTELSICIPTKNFGQFIGQTLDSIIQQADDFVEIVVLDGGSTDNTEEIVKKYQSIFSGLRYYRHDKAGGVDRDLAAAIELATGRYCWPMSADDVIRPGAVQQVLKELKLGYDTYIFNRIDCTVTLTLPQNRYWLTHKIDDSDFNFCDSREVEKYFNSAQSLGAVFSYISTIVFSKELWRKVAPDEKISDTHYLLAYTLLKALQQGGRHKYIRDHFVLCRGGNDSFLDPGDEGIVRRYLLDLDGYLAIESSLKYSPRIRNAFFGIMRKEHPWYTWIRVAIRSADKAKWNEVLDKLFTYGYSPFQLFLIRLARQVEQVLPIFRMLRRARKGLKA